jgi:hypothetical protein
MKNFVFRICLLVFTVLPLIFLIQGAEASNWRYEDGPDKISKSFNSFFEQLPLKAEISNKKIAWPANHWANIDSGIAFRWTAANSNSFKYRSPSRKELKKYTEAQISELSPAEKFSIIIGDYNYQTVNLVWRETSPTEASWNGICHGVAPASIDYEEPQQVVVNNYDGIPIKFYSSDVKALLSFFYARIVKPSTNMLGIRCNSAEGTYNSGSQNCSGINPAAFHIVLANKIGIQKKPFIADIDRYLEVWNHVAINYESYIVDEYAPAATSANGTVKRIRVQSSVTYASAIAQSRTAVIGTEDAYYFDQPYDYYLDLDSIGRIIGGEWVGDIRPDFIWLQRKPNLFGKWKNLLKIYKPIVN